MALKPLRRLVALEEWNVGMTNKGTEPQARTVEWLKNFGLVPRADLAAMLGISEKSLQNRRRDQQPSEIVRIGNSTFYTETSVREFLARHTVKQDA